MIPYSRFWTLFVTNLHRLSLSVFSKLPKVRSFRIQRFIKRNIKKCLGLFLICFKCPGVSKNRNNWFGEEMTGSKIQKSWKWGVLGSPMSKSIFYYTKSKQNNAPELLNLLLKHILQKKGPKSALIILMNFLWFSYDLLMNVATLSPATGPPI